MHRISLQKVRLNKSCFNRQLSIKASKTFFEPSPCRTSLLHLKKRAIQTNLKPGLVTSLPLFSALNFRHIDDKKAVRIGSSSAPATPSEIEVAENTHQSKYLLVRICKRIIQWLDDYVLEPILTVRRLAHILLLFTPVVITVPIVFFGQKSEEQENSGTLWWYDFLATQMERAGPTFIKVIKELEQ